MAAALATPFHVGSRGWGTLGQQNHADGGESGMVGMFVCLCFASQKPSEREFFDPARMDLGVNVNSLTAIDGHESQFVNELLCSLVTSLIFVHC